MAASRLREADRQADKSRSKERAVISQRENTLFVSQHFDNLQKQCMESSKKKTAGRPVQLTKRESSTGIRLTKAERFIIFQKARRTGMTLTSYIRQMAIRGTVETRFTDEERQVVSQLVQMSTDIHQLAQVAKDQGILKAMLHFESMRNKFDGLLNRIRHDK